MQQVATDNTNLLIMNILTVKYKIIVKTDLKMVLK